MKRGYTADSFFQRYCWFSIATPVLYFPHDDIQPISPTTPRSAQGALIAYVCTS